MSTEAAFTLRAPDGELAPEAKIELFQHDIDSRSNHRILESNASKQGSLDLPLSHEPGLYTLKVEGGGEIQIAPENDEVIEISISSGVLTADGSSGTRLLQEYEVFRKESLSRLVYSAREKIKDAKSKGVSDEAIEQLTQMEVDNYQAHLRELNDFVIQNIGNSIALYATSLRWNLDYRGPELANLVDTFAEKYGNIAATRSMEKRIHTSLRVAIGAKAPEISASDLEGNPLSLSDFRGQYVLVDFWASWCPPCRIENKHYASLIKTLDGQEFTVFAVNLDNNEKLWTQAARRDHANWPQVSDLEGWNSPIASKYGVTALPASFLLDPEGRIIAKNLRGAALDQKLRSLGISFKE